MTKRFTIIDRKITFTIKSYIIKLIFIIYKYCLISRLWTHWKLNQSGGSHLATPRAIERVLRPVSMYPATFARVINFSAKSIGFHDL